MIRLVAIDLDGTLLSPDKTISPANKHNKTGRTLCSPRS